MINFQCTKFKLRQRDCLKFTREKTYHHSQTVYLQEGAWCERVGEGVQVWSGAVTVSS